MKVVMQTTMSGTRNGVAWPAKGETVDLPDDEAATLCANGLAVPVRSDQDDVEKRTPKRAKAAAKSGEEK